MNFYNVNSGKERLDDPDCMGRGCHHEIAEGEEYWWHEVDGPLCYKCAIATWGECSCCHYPTQIYRRRGDRFICEICFSRLANADAEEELRRLEADEEADHELRIRKGD